MTTPETPLEATLNPIFGPCMWYTLPLRAEAVSRACAFEPRQGGLVAKKAVGKETDCLDDLEEMRMTDGGRGARWMGDDGYTR